jgi:AmiR/NasT family two-component response regulator
MDTHEWARLGASVAQASGMVAAQCGATPEDGLTLMRRRASNTDTTLDEIAAAVIERRIRFGPSEG